MSNYKVIKKTTEGTEKHGVFVTNTGFLRVTPRTPWLISSELSGLLVYARKYAALFNKPKIQELFKKYAGK
jgi:hypothetical protein